MKHDEDYLKNIWSTRTVEQDNCGPQDCREYHEHMARWRSVADGELPEISCFVALLCLEEFNGMHDHPMIAYYDKDRDLFAADGEEIPHAAVLKWKTIDLPEVE